MRIFFVGFPGCGKSTVGKKIASRLGYQFIDLDDYIEKRAETAIPEIFKNLGEDYFRKIESYSLKEISGMDKVVVSTGGGTPCFNNNMELINSTGISIYLKMSSDTLVSRLSNAEKERPLISGMQGEDLRRWVNTKLNEREFFYAQAHFKVKAKDLKTEELYDFLIQNAPI
jgi:shikimate kinase